MSSTKVQPPFRTHEEEREADSCYFEKMYEFLMNREKMLSYFGLLSRKGFFEQRTGCVNRLDLIRFSNFTLPNFFRNKNKCLMVNHKTLS